MKKRLFICGGLIVALSLTILAFVPHYSCACAPEYDGSYLKHIVYSILPL
jgi:hypothetical protein